MKKLFVSFSGGRSSAMMCHLLKTHHSKEYEMVFVFANTGQEHEDTLRFANDIDKMLNLNLVWVEAVVHHGERIGCTHKVVSYETAARCGEPFESVVRKYGISNQKFPHCTRELKLNPMYSYIESIGWKKGDYSVAMGIRPDEPRRLKKDPRFVYPLVDHSVDKSDVLDFWKNSPIDLKIKEHQGNCTWCWKKSDKKHILNIRENRHWYNFPDFLEEKYSLARLDLEDEPRVFFRQKRSTKDMFKLADMCSYSDDQIELLVPRSTEDGGCSESCEAFLDP